MDLNSDLSNITCFEDIAPSFPILRLTIADFKYLVSFRSISFLNFFPPPNTRPNSYVARATELLVMIIIHTYFWIINKFRDVSFVKNRFST